MVKRIRKGGLEVEKKEKLCYLSLRNDRYWEFQNCACESRVECLLGALEITELGHSSNRRFVSSNPSPRHGSMQSHMLLHHMSDSHKFEIGTSISDSILRSKTLLVELP